MLFDFLFSIHVLRLFFVFVKTKAYAFYVKRKLFSILYLFDVFFQSLFIQINFLLLTLNFLNLSSYSELSFILRNSQYKFDNSIIIVTQVKSSKNSIIQWCFLSVSVLFNLKIDSKFYTTLFWLVITLPPSTQFLKSNTSHKRTLNVWPFPSHMYNFFHRQQQKNLWVIFCIWSFYV